jgi:hypothetical protein
VKRKRERLVLVLSKVTQRWLLMRTLNKTVENGNVNARTMRLNKELTPLHKDKWVPLRSPFEREFFPYGFFLQSQNHIEGNVSKWLRLPPRYYPIEVYGGWLDL